MIKLIVKYASWFAFIWTAVIFVLCCTPGKYVPTAHWLELLSFDKFVHATMFFILASVWFIVFEKKKKLTSINIGLVLACCIAYGGMLEIMQATVFSQRSGDWFDFIANSCGCFLALWLFTKKKYLISANT